MQLYPIEDARHHFQHPGEGRKIALGDMIITAKTLNGATSAPFSVYEAQIPPYYAALSAHVHRTTTEWFYVLSGTLAFTLDNETVMARAGGFILVAPGVVHTIWNPTAAAAALLGFHSRPDFALHMTRLSELIGAAPAWSPAHAQALLALAAEYDQFPADSTTGVKEAANSAIDAPL